MQTLNREQCEALYTANIALYAHFGLINQLDKRKEYTVELLRLRAYSHDYKFLMSLYNNMNAKDLQEIESLHPGYKMDSKTSSKLISAIAAHHVLLETGLGYIRSATWWFSLVAQGRLATIHSGKANPDDTIH